MKPVLRILPEQLKLLEEFYLEVNTEKRYEDHPVYLYHGYFQRRQHCQAGGNRGVYIDSAGYINACPFCHTRQYRATELINGTLSPDGLQVASCPAFDTKDA